MLCCSVSTSLTWIYKYSRSTALYNLHLRYTCNVCLNSAIQKDTSESYDIVNKPGKIKSTYKVHKKKCNNFSV